MRKSRFYSDTNLALGAKVRLSDNAATHATRVLRMSAGDTLILFNGDGHDYTSELISINKHEVLAKVLSSQAVENESPLAITLLQGISSGDRMDYTIQKAVELGVKHIQPIATERSVVKLNQERMVKRIKHWQNVAISACEQSGRAFVPTIASPLSLRDWLAHHPQSQSYRILLNPVGAERLAELEKPTGEIVLLIGAEGGLSSAEVDIATANGFQSIVLGPRILRTETAALTAISCLQSLWGDF